MVKINYKTVNNIESDSKDVILYIDSVPKQVKDSDCELVKINSLDNIWLKKINIEDNVTEFKLATVLKLMCCHSLYIRVWIPHQMLH